MNFARTINFSILIAFLFITSLCSYSQDSSKKAKEIYANAKDNLNKLSYKTILEEKEKNEQIIDMFFHKVSQDGTVFTRREIIRDPLSPTNPLNPYIVITNDQGRFQLIKGKARALKINYQMSIKEIDETGLNISYSLSEGDYKGIPCYIITRKIEPNQLAYERYIEALPSYLQQKEKLNKEGFNAFFSSADVSHIARSDNFFRKIKYYGINGKFRGDREYGVVTINPSF